MTPAGLLAYGHPVLARAVAWGPLRFGLRYALINTLLLFVPALVLGLDDIPTPKQNIGLVYEPNWSLMFPLVLPLIFAGFVYLGELMFQAAAVLSSPGVAVITPRGETSRPYTVHVAGMLALERRTVLAIATGLAALLVVLDTLALWPVYAQSLGGRGIFGLLPSPSPDWTTAFLRSDGPSRAENLLMVVIAYACEGVAIFLGFFFLLKFHHFFRVFSATVNPRTATPFGFDPMEHDDRLGLRPLGKVMNLYLSIVILFQCYVLLHRLQLIGRSESWTIPIYVSQLFGEPWNLTLLLDQRLYAWESTDVGMWLLLVFMTVPLVVASYFPLWTLRRYVSRRRDEEYEQHARARNDALAEGNTAAAAEHERGMSGLDQAELWPNGDSMGRRLLGINVFLAVAAIAPPCALVVASVLAGGEGARGLINALRK